MSHTFPSKDVLQVKNEELENYFANTIIPQLFVDAHLILRKFTPPAMTHFDLSTQDLGKKITDVKDNLRYPGITDNIREVILSEEILEKEVQTTDGKWYQMNILPYKVRKENRTNGVIITFVDITSRIHLLRDLEKLNAEHETLLFALTHDIRQPLSALSLMAEVLEQAFEKQDRARFQHCIKRYRSCVTSVKNLLNNFVAANTTGAEAEKKLERINIGSVVEDVTIGLRSQTFTSQNIENDIEASEVFFSRNNFRSIVYNLLNNSVKYAQPDRELKVKITTRKLDGFVLVQVKDNGIGIAPEKQERIFAKGERLDHSIEGTGMGLFIIRRMLESHGGRIEVESTPGEGSTFSVYFREKPVAPAK